TANLVQRVETAIGAAGAKKVCQGLRRAAEQGAGQAVGGATEVGVVKDVEELGPEAKAGAFGDAKHPLHPDIRLRRVEPAQHIAAEVALLPRGRCRKSRFVQNLAPRISTPE